ncbi:uncharacterized protein LOC123261589 [Cotesia glomerata]|nr:uncharacterized protein LOC123261589 [Cotesia glomerata]
MDKEIHLIGKPMQKISERKLPTVKEVMSVFFYQLKVLKCSIKQSAKNATDQVIELWKNNQIPTSGSTNVIQKILRYHNRWLKLQKSFVRKKSSAQNKNVIIFQNEIKALFDIVDHKSIKLLDNDIRELYSNQKSDTRKEILSNNPNKLNSTMNTMEVDESHLNQPSTSHEIVRSEESESSSTLTLSQATNFGSDLEYVPQIPTTRAKINILTPELISALDRANVSSRNAMFIIAPVLSSVGVNVEDTTLSYRTIQRTRMLLRKDIAIGLKDNFKAHDKYVVHWDGKILNDISESKFVDRLPIILTAFGTEQLLGVPKMNSGSAENQTATILSTLNQWGIISYIKAMCFDTTAVNTGIHHGTCKEIEKALGKELIWLPCRHHIYEIILRSAFEVYWPVSSGPNVPIFGRFKKFWDTFDKTKYKSGVEDSIVANIITNEKNNLSSFIKRYLQLSQPRDDYKEILELSLIFLGEMPREQVFFKRPGAVHHARWMAKAIYCLKMFIFRDEFDLSKKELDGLRQFCIFIVMVYVKAWFSSTSATSAANHDLEFMKNLIEYSKINSLISSATCEKMTSHLWYLSDELAILSLFDDTVPLNIKKNIVEAVKTREGTDSKARRFIIDRKNLHLILQKNISDFVSKKSLKLFEIFDLPYDFLDKNIDLWSTDESYNENKEFFAQLKVVNDVAERGVALVSEYNQCLTKDEEQFQFYCKF